MKIGVIADDFTGASDIASILATGGMRTTLYVNTPLKPSGDTVEAGVVALKSRTISAKDAIRLALNAHDWLLDQGCSQIVFKYCSTFDSTPEGNIGPVAAALAGRMGETRVIVCPAYPATARTVFQGTLFVGDVPLAESSMRDHPLTPMRDSDVRRLLASQTDWPVEHLNAATVKQGAKAVEAALEGPGRAMIVADAICDDDLIVIGQAAAGRKLLTGGAGIATGLPGNFGCTPDDIAWQPVVGRGAVISGSCSSATRAQVSKFRATAPSREVTAEDVVTGRVTAQVLAEWADAQRTELLIYSSADPETIHEAQSRYGRDHLAKVIESLFAELAAMLVHRGFRRIVAAGGETSGAVVQGLGLTEFQIGPLIAPGVPALHANKGNLRLALKSGNFGQDDFFRRSLEMLGHE